MALAGLRRCPSCGWMNVGAHANCLNCSAALPAVELPSSPLPAVEPPPTPSVVQPVSSAASTIELPPPPTAAAQRCPACGAAVGATDRFCRSCGTAIAR